MNLLTRLKLWWKHRNRISWNEYLAVNGLKPSKSEYLRWMYPEAEVLSYKNISDEDKKLRAIISYNTLDGLKFHPEETVEQFTEEEYNQILERMRESVNKPKVIQTEPHSEWEFLKTYPYAHSNDCYYCERTGWIGEKKCWRCDGTGKIE